jgi:hypothetical protein
MNEDELSPPESFRRRQASLSVEDEESAFKTLHPHSTTSRPSASSAKLSDMRLSTADMESR